MRFISYSMAGRKGLGIKHDQGYWGLMHEEFPHQLEDIISQGAAAIAQAASTLRRGRQLDLQALELLPPIRQAGKIICIGLNYVDHSIESGFAPPTYPTVFARFNSGLVAHGQPIVRPLVSHELDYEGELAVIIGKGGRRISATDALGHVAGYSIFNDGSIRDYQRISPQWTVGKNFDGTGAFGPEFITQDELPPGCKGLRLQTRLNGTTVQSASTSDMIFDVASLITILSEAFTLYPNDVLVTGTPAGVGLARKPPLWMKAGDICEVEIEGLGILGNPIVDEAVTNIPQAEAT